jgi:alkylation response protein AidB-like acyl-CoA dehydrogenase
MEFTFTAAENCWREEVREFLAAEAPVSYPYEEQHQDWDFYRKLGRKGWLTLDWPTEFRGCEPATKMEQLIFLDELGYSWAPSGHVVNSGTTLVAHLVMKYGTREQQQLLLPGIAAGDFVCAQGFTEPEAGSDIAALRTRATPDGDDFVLDGQKVFSSSAHFAKYYLVAARTDPGAVRHRGLSLFLVDLESPGIQLQPFELLAGGRNNVVFLDGVRVPRSMLIGELNQGWALMQDLLSEEHGGPAVVLSQSPPVSHADRLVFGEQQKGGELGRVVDELCGYLVAHDIRPAGAGLPSWRALAEAWLQVWQWQLRLYHEASLQDRRFPGMPMTYTPLGFIPSRELYARVADLGLSVLGGGALLERGADDEARVPLQGRIAWMLRAAPIMTIAGGTHEVAKNVAVRTSLGLPKSY